MFTRIACPVVLLFVLFWTNNSKTIIICHVVNSLTQPQNILLQFCFAFEVYDSFPVRRTQFFVYLRLTFTAMQKRCVKIKLFEWWTHKMFQLKSKLCSMGWMVNFYVKRKLKIEQTQNQSTFLSRFFFAWKLFPTATSFLSFRPIKVNCDATENLSTLKWNL